MAKRDAELKKEIGERAAKRRNELNLTQENVAEKAGLSQQFYACIERGIKGASAETLLKLSRALNISADYLLTGAMTQEEQDYINRMLRCLSEEQRLAAEEIIKNLLIACGYDLPT